ncbi:MAG: glutathione S-transferase family protein [Pseudomonadota bacterium]
MLEEAGVDYQVHQPEEAPPGRFTFPQITLGTGETIGQVPVILNVLGDKFGLTGRSEIAKILCQQAVLDADDIFSAAQSGVFSENPARAAQWFGLLQEKLAHTRFLVADTPTVADFHAVFATEWVHKSFSPDAYDSFPRLAQWWKDICEHPPVQRMKTSGIPMIP